MISMMGFGGSMTRSKEEENASQESAVVTSEQCMFAPRKVTGMATLVHVRDAEGGWQPCMPLTLPTSSQVTAQTCKGEMATRHAVCIDNLITSDVGGLVLDLSRHHCQAGLSTKARAT